MSYAAVNTTSVARLSVNPLEEEGEDAFLNLSMRCINVNTAPALALSVEVKKLSSCPLFSRLSAFPPLPPCLLLACCCCHDCIPDQF